MISDQVILERLERIEALLERLASPAYMSQPVHSPLNVSYAIRAAKADEELRRRIAKKAQRQDRESKRA